VTVNEYWPGSRFSNAKVPLASVLAAVSNPTVRRRKLMEAFGTTAPLESKTCPEIAEFFTSANRLSLL
jgi:hypothetical protein